MRRGRPPSWASSVKDAPEHPDDAREGFWPRAQLVKMNARFVARLEHAVATGRERVTIAPHARARSPYLVGGLSRRSDKWAAAHSDKCPPSVRCARRFLTPAAICRMVGLMYMVKIFQFATHFESVRPRAVGAPLALGKRGPPFRFRCRPPTEQFCTDCCTDCCCQWA
jgi:hypothetical protein